ncbi:MAG: FAD-binding domain-containing protein [Bacteroidota bacterium]
MNGFLFHKTVSFSTRYPNIVQRIHAIDPITYGSTRNFIDGAVTYLSPYISRGVVSTRQVFNSVLQRGYRLKDIEKFIQELAWRDYWQQLWVAKGDAINTDLKKRQHPVGNTAISAAIVNATTGIEAIDTAIAHFYATGYLHNHVRMYIASVACNIAQSHWKLPAHWMYYYLLDADWASNALSWQWVAGANSPKKYYANQENINRYCYTTQKDTFLDVGYDAFATLEIPKVLQELNPLCLETPLPAAHPITIDDTLPTLLYNFYNLDPLWKEEISANRILLLEPSHFKAYPVSQKTIDFVLGLSKNIKDIQVYVGEFHQLIDSYALQNIHYKEHPLNSHYQGTEMPRDWMFDVRGYYPSFFAFWKKCKKEITVTKT